MLSETTLLILFVIAIVGVACASARSNRRVREEPVAIDDRELPKRNWWAIAIGGAPNVVLFVIGCGAMLASLEPPTGQRGALALLAIVFMAGATLNLFALRRRVSWRHG